MSDIIDTIDRLHAKATPGRWEVHGIVGHIEVLTMDAHTAPVVPIARFHALNTDGPSGAPEFNVATSNAEFASALVNNWPAISARLREAERKATGFANISGAVARWEREERCQSTSAMELVADLVKETEAAIAAKETKQ